MEPPPAFSQIEALLGGWHQPRLRDPMLMTSWMAPFRKHFRTERFPPYQCQEVQLGCHFSSSEEGSDAVGAVVNIQLGETDQTGSAQGVHREPALAEAALA